MATRNAEVVLLPTPDQVFNRGRDHISQLGMLSTRFAEWADTYEQRIGADYFNQFKWVADEGEVLTPAEEEYNAQIDYMAEWTLQMVGLYNTLRDEFLTPHVQQVIGKMRTDV